jgi:hypothetical protein
VVFLNRRGDDDIEFEAKFAQEKLTRNSRAERAILTRA